MVDTQLSKPAMVDTAASALFPKSVLWFLIFALLMLPLGGYILLPALGIGRFIELFNLTKSVLLFGGLIGGVAYLVYLRFVLPRPQVLVAFILLGWALLAYLNGQLLKVGVNIKMTPLMFVGIGIPALWISCKNSRLLLSSIPWLKYYLLFFFWLLLYTLVFNANATDPRLGGGADAGEGSVSWVQLTAYFYCLMAMTVSGVAGLKIRNFRGAFDTLNKALLWITGFESLLTIGGYPFGWFNMMLDGFMRSVGIFSHPNPFAHHMGILMVYLMGLFCYYQGERKSRIPGWLLLGGIAINFMAFLLALSKTALGVFILCAGILFLMNLAVPAVRRGFLQTVAFLAVLAPFGLLGFEAISGQSFLGLLESRIDQTESLNWRTQVWQDLIADIQGASILLGHGFTAANTTVFHLTFNDARNAQPLMMVHNAYIALLYDLGLMGYTMFLAVFSLIFHAVSNWLKAIRPELRTEHSIIFALSGYFLCVCCFDEMSYMFDAPMLFWSLVTLLYCLALRENQESNMIERPAG